MCARGGDVVLFRAEVVQRVEVEDGLRHVDARVEQVERPDDGRDAFGQGKPVRREVR